MGDDDLWIKFFSIYIQFLSLLVSIILYKKYKNYSFYKYFVLYLCNISIFHVLSNTLTLPKGNIELYNIYTFFEFNLFVFIYYNLIKVKRKFVKVLAVIFNVIYLISFYFVFLKVYTVPIEGAFNSLLIILYFIELLNSDKVMNQKKLLAFWISVGFLIFYVTSVPFFTLLYAGDINTRGLFQIIYYLIVVFHLCLIYGLVTCYKKNTMNSV